MSHLPKDYLSYNQIKVYQTCPLKYYFSYFEEISSTSNDKLILGSAFHEALEKFLNNKINGIHISEKELISIFKTVFNEIVNKNEVNWIETKAYTLKKGVSFIHFFYNEVADTIKPLMAEKELSFIIPELNIELKGVLDLIEEDFSISDFKTSTAKWSNSRVQYSKLQTIIYKYLFEKNFESTASDIKFKVFYSKNDKNIKYQNIIVKTECDDIQNMIKIVEFVIDSIKQGNFYKNETYACNFCDYRHICKDYSSTGVILKD